jgi:hypothetical protein
LLAAVIPAKAGIQDFNQLWVSGQFRHYGHMGYYEFIKNNGSVKPCSLSWWDRSFSFRGAIT